MEGKGHFLTEVVIYTAAGTLALYKFTIYTAAGCHVKRFICTAAVDQVIIAIYTAAVPHP